MRQNFNVNRKVDVSIYVKKLTSNAHSQKKCKNELPPKRAGPQLDYGVGGVANRGAGRVARACGHVAKNWFDVKILTYVSSLVLPSPSDLGALRARGGPRNPITTAVSRTHSSMGRLGAITDRRQSLGGIKI